MLSPTNNSLQNHFLGSPCATSSRTPSTQRSLVSDRHCTPTYQCNLTSASPHTASSQTDTPSPGSSISQKTRTPGLSSPGGHPLECNTEHLKHTVMTPGIFQTQVRSSSSRKSNFWELEQEAVLNPTDLGDVTKKIHEQERQNRKYEWKVQHASNQFWNNYTVIAASPSPSAVQLSQKRTNSLARIDEEQKSVSNASCQTDIHLPLSLDVQELFKEYILSASQIEELNKGDSFSNSSLRRKLFENDGDFSDSAPSTPEKEFPVSELDFLQSPISSSPMFGKSGEHSTIQRRCSQTRLIDSDVSPPDISPISSPSSAMFTTGLESFGQDLVYPSNVPDDFCQSYNGLESGDQEMSVTQHSSFRVEPPRTEHMLRRSVLSPLRPDTSVGASMASQPDHSRLQQSTDYTATWFGGQSASDTGYQSQSASRYYLHIEDFSTILEAGKQECQRTTRPVNNSPPKSSPRAWTPPSSSTPTKAPIEMPAASYNDSVLYNP